MSDKYVETCEHQPRRTHQDEHHEFYVCRKCELLVAVVPLRGWPVFEMRRLNP